MAIRMIAQISAAYTTPYVPFPAPLSHLSHHGRTHTIEESNEIKSPHCPAIQKKLQITLFEYQAGYIS